MTTRQRTIPSTVVNVTPYHAKRTSVLVQVVSGGAIFLAEDQVNVATIGIRLAVGDTFGRVRSMGGQPELALFAIRETVDAVIAIVEDFGALEKGLEAPL